MYDLVRKALFCLSGETAHQLSLELLDAAYHLKLLQTFGKTPVQAPVEVMGLTFPNAVGLAAGLDKNADHVDSLGALGFGFVEVGTVTPKPQPGNPLPRLFRIPEKESLINRMGFNNAGIEHLIRQVSKRHYPGILGINLGKNLSTPVEKALDDYLYGLNAAYAHADYITINISSPNTPGLRHLQLGEALENLLKPLKQRQAELSQKLQRYVPLAVKIAPDLDEDELDTLAKSLINLQVDAVVATNTTLDRSAVEGLPHADEAGGLSGAALTERACELTAQLAEKLDGALPIIGVGGIHSAEDALERIHAGASLIQLYTGFIYRGPGLVHDCAESLATAR